MLINSLRYKEMIWQKNCGDKIEFPLTGCSSRWGLLIFITGTLWRPSQLGAGRNQRQLKENGKVTLTMGFHKKSCFSSPMLYKCQYTLFMNGWTIRLHLCSLQRRNWHVAFRFGKTTCLKCFWPSAVTHLPESTVRNQITVCTRKS